MSARAHKTLPVAAVALLFLSLATPLAAQSWNVGYVFVAIGNGQYQVFDNSGVLVQTISLGTSGQTAGCAFNGVFNLYTTDFTNSNVVVFDGANTAHPVLQTLSVAAAPGSGGSVHPESVTFDSSGNFYAGFADLTTLVNGKVKIVPGGHLEEFNSSGAPLGTVTPSTENRGVDWTDFASNQSTFFYTSEGQNIFRFDTVSGQLSPFATGILTASTDQLFALKLLPAENVANPTDLNTFDGSGGLLVADTTNIKRLNGSGQVIQTYTAPKVSNWVALALDPNGTSFWAGDGKTGQIFRFNIATGAIEVGPIVTAAQTNNLNGICVKGAHQQNVVPLNYSAGSNVQRFAAFGNPTSNNYHTWTATVDSVTTPYTIAVSATEGVDFGRFDEYFCNQAQLTLGPCPTPFPPATLTPITYADQVNSSGNPVPGKAVVYRVENPPPTSDYSGNIFFAVAFHPPALGSYTPLTCTVNGQPVPTSNARLFRDPSAPDPVTGFPTDAASNHSFAFDFTLINNPAGKFGDPIYGGGKTYNDYLIADRCPSVAGGAQGTASFNSPLPKSNIKLGSSVPIKVTVVDSFGNTVPDAVTFPNIIIGSIVGPDGKLEAFSNPGGSFSPFTPNGQSYSSNLKTTGLELGLTTICVTSVDQNGAQALINGGGGPGQFASTCEVFTIVP